jgi:hypothetical protein
MYKCFAIVCGALLLLSGTSCGGGGAAAPTPNAGGPAAGKADIVGQLQQGAGSRATSAVGDGLASVLVQLINTATGDLVGVDTTDLQGRYEFKGIPAGERYLLKVEFAPNAALTAAGAGASVELTLPLNPADQQTLSLLQQLGVVDSDGDGQLDAIRFENEIEDNHGVRRHRGSEHRFGDGQTVIDDNGNGDFSDDTPFDDSNHDGIADDRGQDGPGDDHSHDGLVENEVRGAIEAISADSITVGGQTFAITDATRFRDGGVNAPREAFAVGTLVEVEGLVNAAGLVTALKVQLEDEAGDDNGGTVGGGGADDGSGHDAGDDNGGAGGGGADDGAGHDAGDDNGVDG